MLLKKADNKDYVLADLERLLTSATGDRKAKIEQELRIRRAGIKGEQDAAYLIDFDYKDHANWIVIHDLRLEVRGRVAQIDHLLINRRLDCYVLETKHLRSGLKITDEGEFLRWNDYKKTFEGMSSPLAQNERHISVLRDGFGLLDMPTRLGMRLKPVFQSLVLISPDSRIDRPKSFDTSGVIKSDVLRTTINKKIDQESVLGTLGSAARIVSMETLTEIGNQVISLHKPIRLDVAAQFGAPASVPVGATAAPSPPPRPASPSGPLRDAGDAAACGKCRSDKVSIQFGNSYYFKCAACNGNTAIKLNCGKPGHRERLRKAGRQFFRECADCQSSKLFFENAT